LEQKVQPDPTFIMSKWLLEGFPTGIMEEASLFMKEVIIAFITMLDPTKDIIMIRDGIGDILTFRGIPAGITILIT
jgi:hypothetical protein